jgi:hypothetical protein
MGRIVVLPGGKPIHVGGRIIAPTRRQTLHLTDSRFGLNLSQFPPLPQETRYAQAPAAQQCLTNVLKNDKEGCCTQADKFHRQALRQAAGGAVLAFTPADEQVEAAYTRDGGQPGDQGCDEQVVMTNEQTIGDPCGPAGSDGIVPIDKSLGFLGVDATNITLVQQCVAIFVGGSVCMGLPEPWVAKMPSQSGWTWDVPRGGAPSGYFDPANGHCFSLYDYSTGNGGTTLLGIGSWGMFGFLTPDALAAGAVASSGGMLYFVIDQQILSKAACVAPDGADWATIQSDFAAIGGTVTP